jgi:NAD(P)-dependent dehydrogenase (short-subunit alcohol dehydrogenase family)
MALPSLSVEGKVTIVTGTSRGIGNALTKWVCRIRCCSSAIVSQLTAAGDGALAVQSIE